MDRALLVGIDRYEDFPLNGCANDINDMSRLLESKCGFNASSILRLIDQQATKFAITNGLNWLLNGLAFRDRILFFFSGHGTQLVTENSPSESDGLSEVICPFDYDWSGTNYISDQYFSRVFSNIPIGVEFIWISDSCHSGDLATINIQNNQETSTPIKYDIVRKYQEASAAGIIPLSLKGVAINSNLALISSCKAGQKSETTEFDGRFNGAFTFFLLSELSSPNGLKDPLNLIINNVRDSLQQNGFIQEPQIEGNDFIINRPFMMGW